MKAVVAAFNQEKALVGELFEALVVTSPDYISCSRVAETAVIQVRARDQDAEDDPLNPAGQIEYSIVSTHKHFKIDAETGWLSTNKVTIAQGREIILCPCQWQVEGTKIISMTLNNSNELVLHTSYLPFNMV